MRVKKSKLKFYVLISLIAVILIASIVVRIEGYNLHIYKHLKDLSFNPYFPEIYVFLYIISSFLPIPFLAFFGAVVLPFWDAFYLSMIGNIISFIMMFYLTRWLGRDFVELYEDKHAKLKELDINLQKNAFGYIFLLRIFYLIPTEAINILAGLSKIKFRDYIVPSIFGSSVVVFLSIAIVKLSLSENYNLLTLVIILFVSLVIIPLFFIKNLRKYFRRNKSVSRK